MTSMLYFEYIFLSENHFILIKISLEFLLDAPIKDKPKLVQIITRGQTRDKPFSELMVA